MKTYIRKILLVLVISSLILTGNLARAEIWKCSAPGQGEIFSTAPTTTNSSKKHRCKQVDFSKGSFNSVNMESFAIRGRLGISHLTTTSSVPTTTWKAQLITVDKGQSEDSSISNSCLITGVANTGGASGLKLTVIRKPIHVDYHELHNIGRKKKLPWKVELTGNCLETSVEVRTLIE
jgi:hypothetical protein